MSDSRKIFVSYKHGDNNVAPLSLALNKGEITQGRHYATYLEGLLKQEGQIYKGEKDGESLDQFKDETIESKLRDKIFDSSITIVLISKNMKNEFESEGDQWIPWEVSYSLKNMKRGEKTSRPNGVLAVVVPDENNNYSYIVNHYPCVTVWSTNRLFDILNLNMFNRKKHILKVCDSCGGNHHIGKDHSYIHPVKWCDFVNNIKGYIEHIATLSDSIDEFDMKILN